MPTLPLVPAPAVAHHDPDAAPFRLSAGSLASDGTPAADAAAAALVRLIAERTDELVPRDADGTIRLALAPEESPESYRLVVDADSVSITGGDAAGLFYGVQTLVQLVSTADEGWVVPAIEIADAPRFAYRSAMLDVARHFFPLQVVKGYVDRIAALKFNHLHVHLSDDQGWRIEIASRPELTAKASASAALGDEGGWYTKLDYAELVEYAASRHVTIVPEIDMPGHTHAVGLAYPDIAADPVYTAEVSATVEQFGRGFPQPGEPYTGFAVGFSSLRIDDERSYDFVRDVFRELAESTPGPFLHLGGDEAHGTSAADYAAFVSRAIEIVRETGKTPIAWHEAGRVPGLPAGMVAQYWGYLHPEDGADEAARAVVEAGGRLIISPADVAYLDMKTHADAELGLAWAKGPTSVAEAYGWEPTEIVAGIDEGDILGVEAPMWTETIRTAADIDAMAFPRIAAVAEIAWSPRTSPLRGWESFRARVGALAPAWTAAGIAFGRSPEIPWADA